MAVRKTENFETFNKLYLAEAAKKKGSAPLQLFNAVGVMPIARPYSEKDRLLILEMTEETLPFNVRLPPT